MMLMARYENFITHTRRAFEWTRIAISEVNVLLRALGWWWCRVAHRCFFLVCSIRPKLVISSKPISCCSDAELIFYRLDSNKRNFVLYAVAPQIFLRLSPCYQVPGSIDCFLESLKPLSTALDSLCPSNNVRLLHVTQHVIISALM